MPKNVQIYLIKAVQEEKLDFVCEFGQTVLIKVKRRDPSVVPTSIKDMEVTVVFFVFFGQAGIVYVMQHWGDFLGDGARRDGEIQVVSAPLSMVRC